MRARTLAAAALAAFAAVSPGFAWTAATRVRMVDDALKLMPPSLRQALEARREALLRGMLTPMTSEDAPGHRPPWDGGTLPASVEGAAKDVIAGSEGRQPFSEIARKFGVLAHYVADAGFPPGAAGPSGADRYAHFAAFCQERRGRFPLVFYGHGSVFLAKADDKGFTKAILERARAEDKTLAAAYAAAPSWNDPPSFDDRSVPFAMASLSYSHSVTDIVQAWLSAWARCHGDLGGTPYAGKPATDASTK
jgi:hypothetical protein